MVREDGLPEAVVFDCDGTLVDTEPLSYRMIRMVLGEMGRDFTDDDYEAVVGRAWPHTARYLEEVVGVEDVEDYRERLSAAFGDRFHDEVEVFVDAAALARELAERGVKVAVCTSSGRPHLARVFELEALAGIEFAATVTREDTERHKPRPEPYLLAAERLGVEPSRCVAIEDSPAGTKSALAAGMRVVVVDRGQHADAGFVGLPVTRTEHLTLSDLTA